MFTGIVQAVGCVRSVTVQDFGVRLLVDAAGWDYTPKHGDSIAVNGCCLTFAPGDSDAANVLAFDIVQQTLQCTTLGKLQATNRVNLESCVTPTTAMGGHFVQGHIDGVGTITNIIATPQEHRMTIQLPPQLMPFVVPRGSITVDGVSLTIAEVCVKDNTFDIALIPTTLQLTTFTEKILGDTVNIETDILARTAVQYLKHYAKNDSAD